jgi:hypothetical protein
MIWEELLSAMKFLQKIDISVNRINHINVIDLTEYETAFWIERNLQAIVYDDPTPYSTTLCIR